MNEPPITLHAVLINDDAAQLSLFAGLLRKIGCETHTFRSAGEALKVIGQDAPPDLLVTDLYMPGINGWRFCRLVRSPEFPKLNQTPILVTSATYAGDEAARLSAELGANAFLTVPVSAAKFIETVRMVPRGENRGSLGARPAGRRRRRPGRPVVHGVGLRLPRGQRPHGRGGAELLPGGAAGCHHSGLPPAGYAGR